MDEQPNGAHWFSSVQAPERLAAADAVDWDDQAELVVVGYGGAGITAALQAAERGLSVIAIDRYSGGGATAMNGGVFYAGAGTSVQRQAGVEDSVDEMYNYLRVETQGVVSDATLRRFCQGSPATIEWLIGHGVRFDGSACFPSKIFYPPAGYFLYYSDSSLSEAYRRLAKPAARGHKVWHPPSNQASGFGVHLTTPLREAAAKRGVRELHHADVRRLVLGPDGAVLGVIAEHMPADTPEAARYVALREQARDLLLKLPSSMPGFARLERQAQAMRDEATLILEKHGVRRRIRAHGGVCLSAGGYIWNRAMVAHYAPAYANTMAMGLPGGDEGGGLRLGQTAGARPDGLHRMSAWRFINPPAAFSSAMLVNARGERYVNEALYGAAIGKAMVEGQGGRGWIVMDRKAWRSAWRESVFHTLFPFMRLPLLLALLLQSRRARNPRALAKKLGFDTQTFEDTLAGYNRLAEGRGVDPMGKAASECKPLRQGPLYAVDVSVTTKFFPCPTMSLGGLRVNEETGEVLLPDGAAIAGLYAAGRTAIGLSSNLYVSGLSMADCVFSGRRVAHHVASARSSKLQATSSE